MKIFSKSYALIGLLIILAVSCAKGPGRIEGQMFTDKKNGFAVEFPEGWLVDSSGYLGTAVMFMDDSKENGFKPNVNVVLQRKCAFSVSQYAEGMKDSIINLLEDYKFIGFGDALLSGSEAKMLEYAFNQKELGRIKQRQYFVKNEDTMYVITCSAAEDEFEAKKNIFENFVKSFKLLNRK